MTEDRYNQLISQGMKLFPKVVGELNRLMPMSLEKTAEAAQPKYRTHFGFTEICLALALMEERNKND